MMITIPGQAYAPIQLIELAFRLFERRERFLVRHTLHLAETIDLPSSGAESMHGLEWNNGRTYCTDFARIDVHFCALFCLHLPSEFFDPLVSLNYQGYDLFVWDGELKGFGLRIKPSGAGSYLIQYQTPQGRTGDAPRGPARRNWRPIGEFKSAPDHYAHLRQVPVNKTC